MKYLDTDYRLEQVTPASYKAQSRRVSSIQQMNDLKHALRTVTTNEESDLTDVIFGFGDHLHETYGHGGGFFILAAGIGIAALRTTNPINLVPSIQPEDWDSMMARQQELQERPGIRTVESIAGIGLLEVRNVNSGYVDGYQETFDTPRLSPFLGLTGLGALVAHDLVHYASMHSSNSPA
jgi:hypothetical protein